MLACVNIQIISHEYTHTRTHTHTHTQTHPHTLTHTHTHPHTQTQTHTHTHTHTQTQSHRSNFKIIKILNLIFRFFFGWVLLTGDEESLRSNPNLTLPQVIVGLFKSISQMYFFPPLSRECGSHTLVWICV